MSGAPFRQGKRRRMNKFRILEVASVDFPAQDGATALLLKLGHPDTRRRKRKGGSRLAKSPFEDAPPGVLTDSVNGHAHLIWLHGRAGETSWSKSEGEETGHDHPWMLTAAGELMVGESEGHTHQVDQALVMQALLELTKTREFGVEVIKDQQGLEDAVSSFRFVPEAQREAEAEALRKRAQELNLSETLPANGTVAELLKAGPDGTELENPMADPTAADLLKKATDENEAMKKRQDRLEAILLLKGDARAHFDALEGEEAIVAFLALDATAQTAEVQKSLEKSADSNPVVFTSKDGTEFRKSDDARLVKMARERDEDREELAKARVAGANAEFEKRAEDEIPHLPGDIATRAALLKALGTITDETLRKAATESVVAGSKAMKAAFSRTGTREAPDASGAGAGAEAELEKMAKALVESTAGSANPLTYFDAYEKVGTENPALFAKAVGSTVPETGN